MSLEDDMQEEDGGDVPYLDSEKTESDKKLNDNKDDEFVRIKKEQKRRESGKLSMSTRRLLYGRQVMESYVTSVPIG